MCLVIAGPRSFRVHQAARICLPPEPCRRADQYTQYDLLQLPPVQELQGVIRNQTLKKHTLMGDIVPALINTEFLCFVTEKENRGKGEQLQRVSTLSGKKVITCQNAEVSLKITLVGSDWSVTCITMPFHM